MCLSGPQEGMLRLHVPFCRLHTAQLKGPIHTDYDEKGIFCSCHGHPVKLHWVALMGGPQSLQLQHSVALKGALWHGH